MKLYFLFLLLFITERSIGQEWEAEVMGGVSSYNGDLTQHAVSLNNIGPAATFNLKYNADNFIVIRGGISWAKLSANDKNNRQLDLKNRNLNFKSDILEGSICVEFNLLEPDYFYSYPYLFAGIGVFHFDPYTFNKNKIKTYLQPLSTEGQGLSEYPSRKPYRLTQFCLPVGGGIKFQVNTRWDIIYEFGYRFLLTDYLDDVSTTYVNSQTLFSKKGSNSAELANRQSSLPLPAEHDIRGNPKVKDSYLFTGIKLLIHLSKHNR